MEERTPETAIATTEEAPKNFQQKVWESLGNKGLPSLLFVHQLNYAKLSNEKIKELNIPIETKESIINLKDSLAHQIKKTTKKIKLNENDRNYISALINAGADPEKTKQYLTLCLLENLKFKDLDENDKNTIFFLIDKGADINTQPPTGNTPLILASIYGHKDVIEYLIDKQVNLNVQNNYGLSALMDAIINRHPDIAELLIKKGADVTLKSNYGETALNIAAVSGYVDTAKQIIEKFIALNPNNKEALGKFLDTQNRDGNTALIEAVENNRAKIVQFLLNEGVNRNLRNNQNLNALDIARQKQNQEIIQLLENA